MASRTPWRAATDVVAPCCRLPRAAARHSIASGDTGRPLQPLTQLLLELTQASSASLTAFQVSLPLGSNAAAKAQHAEQVRHCLGL